MCIICKTSGDPEEYLEKFEQAKFFMKSATKAMEVYSKTYKNYGKCHKQMVRVCKEWNSIENIRELSTNEQSPIAQ